MLDQPGQQARHRVAVIGGGFAGLNAIKALRDAPVEVTLLDRRNFHLFQPLLYQVATGALSPANIAAPLRSVLRRQPNVRVLLGEATGFDLPGRRVLTEDGELPYDTLIVATGASHHYFGHEEWRTLAPGLKTVEDATGIRSRLLNAFEAAEREPDQAQVRALLTFLIVGGGPTGVELAGAIAEIANDTLTHDYRHIRPDESRILLVEALDRVLPAYPPSLSRRAERDLLAMGVDVRTGATVEQITPESVLLRTQSGPETIETRTVLWAAGVSASPLGQALAGAAGVALDRSGRVIVERDLTLPGHPEVFVLGDLAHAEENGRLLPGVAPVAIQEGAYAASVIKDRLRGEPSDPFHYRDQGNLATIGHSKAVADLGWLKLTGFVAWLAWLFVHIMYLERFENRLLVLTQWTWNYFTHNRSARLITEQRARRVDRESGADVRKP
jgi:NADH dehydrogenase